VIPVRDSIRSRRFPAVTVGIIAANIAVYIYQSNLGPRAVGAFFLRYGIVPVRFSLLPGVLASGRFDVAAQILQTLVTGMFLHGGLVHLLGNMLYLWVFGDNVEDRLTPVRFVLLYLATGIAGTACHMAAAPQSTVPLIGASGAIAGVLGAYFVSFPRSRVLALVPLFFFLHLTEVPAVIFLLLWFALQLVNGLGALSPESASVVAWWAHVGGFAMGALLVGILAPRRRRLGLEPSPAGGPNVP
jgi:membrane associated rhomboid family serine protease